MAAPFLDPGLPDEPFVVVDDSGNDDGPFLPELASRHDEPGPEQGMVATPFNQVEPSEERKDIRSEGFPWPGEWTEERDQARHQTTVHWSGKDEGHYPRGTQTDFENLTYKVDDAHPDTSSVLGEVETVFVLQGRELRWRGHLAVTTDQKNFYYSYTRELLKDGTVIRKKTWNEVIARDHQ